ncbi:MAG: hypothetical protein JWM86_1877 [Thermoleophilia bacterium]|nr:hypothetical protein [Thermoleophilia bacterium]
MAGDALIATLALGGMCLLMWWLARLARKRMGVGAGTVTGSGLRVVGKRPLDQRHSLFVVEIAGGRHILVGAGVDGPVTKLDDISPEEFAAMTDEPKPVRTPLTVAGAPNDGDAGEPHGPHLEPESADVEQRFASVGESFSHFYSKAKDARSSRRDRKASGE